jgi:DNA-binding NarL/FixJ family response regulator
LVILDISMPYLNGIEATRELHKKGVRTRIVILSMFSDYYLVKGALEAGADGYLLKRLVGEELIPAIFQINEGQVYLSQGLGNDAKGLPVG